MTAKDLAHDSDPIEPTDSRVLIPSHHAWWLVGASKQGRSHILAGSAREDHFGMDASMDEADAGRWFAIAVADGVGTASLARLGSRLAVQGLLSAVRQECEQACPGPDQLCNVLSKSAWQSLRGLEAAALDRQQPIKAFATTLLAVLGIETSDKRIALGLFQAGNGLIAEVSADNSLRSIIDPQDEQEDGSIYDLTSQHTIATWDDRRFRKIVLDPASWGVVLITDGISDDLVPLTEKGGILGKELRSLSATPNLNAGNDLLQLISYQKRGSTDDRTLSCVIFGQQHSCSDSQDTSTDTPNNAEQSSQGDLP